MHTHHLPVMTSATSQKHGIEGQDTNTSLIVCRVEVPSMPTYLSCLVSHSPLTLIAVLWPCRAEGGPSVAGAPSDVPVLIRGQQAIDATKAIFRWVCLQL